MLVSINLEIGCTIATYQVATAAKGMHMQVLIPKYKFLTKLHNINVFKVLQNIIILATFQLHMSHIITIINYIMCNIRVSIWYLHSIFHQF